MAARLDLRPYGFDAGRSGGLLRLRLRAQRRYQGSDSSLALDLTRNRVPCPTGGHIGIDATGLQRFESKHPPAKPGALVWEPLKATYPGGFGAVSHLLRGMRHQVPKLTILITCVSGCTLFAAAQSSYRHPSMGLPFVSLAAHGFRASSLRAGRRVVGSRSLSRKSRREC